MSPQFLGAKGHPGSYRRRPPGRRSVARPAGTRGSGQGLRALALAAAGALSACAGPGAEQGRVNWLGQGEHRIIVTAAAFADADPVRVGFADPWQTEEYAFLQNRGRQLELVFAEASEAFTVALDYQMPIATMVPTWNANARHDLAWGPIGRFDWRPGVWFYRSYRPGRLERACVGLLVEWDEIYEDRDKRPRRLLFGYACGVAGEALEAEEVRALIRGIAIRPRELGSGWRFQDQRAPADPRAVAAARGQGAAAESGNPRFPFGFARYYSDSGGGKRN